MKTVYVALLLFSISLGPVHAATYDFQGVVTDFEDVVPTGQIEARWPVGTVISGSYSFSDGLQDNVNPVAMADPSYGLYTPVLFDVLLPDLTYGTSSFGGGASLRIFNDSTTVAPGTADFYNLNSYYPSGPGYGEQQIVPTAFNIRLTDTDATVFADDGLPTVMPSLTEFENADFLISFVSGDSVHGEITSLTLRGAPVSPIPEPNTYAMLLAGLLMLGFEVRRRRRVTRQ